ncbi:MAG TPA: hypothetical protein VN455_02965 [Methanotrichaceae archaeon]|nr:hypothetical protein [Methanotrichaceae archaeon]
MKINLARSMRYLIVITAALVGISCCAMGAVIDFENITTTGFGQTGQAVLTNQYAAQGVSFNGPVVIDFSHGTPIPNFASSGVQAIEQCYYMPDCYTPIAMNFTSAQQRMRVWFGFSGPLNESRTVALLAFDADGKEAGRATRVIYPSNAPQRISMPLEIRSDRPNIISAEVLFWPAQGANNLSMSGLAVDDVEFEGIAPAAACGSTRVPIVTINSPERKSTISSNELVINGTIDTQSPLIAAILQTTASNGSIKTYDLLSNRAVAPAGGSFSASVGNFLFSGANNVTVMARDCYGLGSSSIDVSSAAAATNAPSTPFAGMPLIYLSILCAWVWINRRNSK